MDVRRQGHVREETAEMPVAALHARGGGMLGKVLVALLIAISVLVLGWFATKAYAMATADSGIKSKQYQAVFLTNGQVYFGKLSKVNADYVKLTNIYYLQVQQTVQPSTTTANSNANPQVSLAKLGNELHGPDDVMYISHDQVLFWENLKNDGKVTKAIADYKASGK